MAHTRKKLPKRPFRVQGGFPTDVYIDLDEKNPHFWEYTGLEKENLKNPKFWKYIKYKPSKKNPKYWEKVKK